MQDKPLVLVTGSTGLIGTAVLNSLRDRYEVVGFDVQQPVDDEWAGRWIHCDLTETQSVQAALRSVRERYGSHLASVIHLAAFYDFSGEPNPLYQELTVEGSARLLHGLQEFDVEQFVFSSSLLVMQPVEETANEGPISEADPLAAKWPYPQSKLAAESTILCDRGTIPVVILRIAGVYDEECNSIPISQHIHRIYERKLESFFFPGDADHGQAFVHLQDAADAVRLTVEARNELDTVEVFLIGEEKVLSYRDLQEALGRLIHGKAWPTIRIPKVAAKAGAWMRGYLSEGQFIKPWMVDLADDDYPIETSRAQSKLGWSPHHSLEDSLYRMVIALKRDPVAWYRRHKLRHPDDPSGERAAANQ
ncbi:MAG: NAD(P)-dependent oxidoreductase [Bdellovibrionales bacterium]|nr:NAD(P)-dependent oxidoreductase [Bdellovibrionales bacterium]